MQSRDRRSVLCPSPTSPPFVPNPSPKVHLSLQLALHLFQLCHPAISLGGACRQLLPRPVVVCLDVADYLEQGLRGMRPYAQGLQHLMLTSATTRTTTMPRHVHLVEGENYI